MGKKEDNHAAVSRGLGLLSKALGPFVEKSLKDFYKGNWWNSGVIKRLSQKHTSKLKKRNDIGTLDVHLLLNVINNNWRAAFFNHKDLEKEHRTWINELISVRNKWAHAAGNKMEEDDAWRGLDTMARFTEVIDSGIAAKIRVVADGVRGVSAPKAVPKTETKQTTDSSIPAWYELVEPNSDVIKGTYSQAEFAADLSEVVKGKASLEYQDPVEFFKRTHMTDGMQLLLETSIKRLTGKGGEPVIQVKTAFGGGKTHAMLALYHLLSGKAEQEELTGIGDLVDNLELTELPKANFAVLVGTDLNVSKPRSVGGLKLHTLWGELAYQIGGKKAYEIIRINDEQGTSPGSEDIREILDKFGPCVILIDELIAYIRQIYSTDKQLSAGSFDANITFIQALTEGIPKSKHSMIIASLPESEIELGGSGGREALKRVEHTFSRVESVWKPVTSSESFEIVRRRLFHEVKHPLKRNEVCRAFARMYADSKGEYPNSTLEGAYLDKMKNSYPIHPEFFDRLYEDWSTLERFQRTRGVLRLMASVVNFLWEKKDGSKMIMPGSIPLHKNSIKNELTRYLGEDWNAVVDKEVAGPNSTPFAMDRTGVAKRFQATQRVATAIFLGSAATLNRNIKGIENVRIRLGVVQPGEAVAHFNDALAKLRDRLSNLFNDQGRYWYDTNPNLKRAMRDLASGYQDDDIIAEISRRLSSGSSKFEGGVHVAPDSGDVPDDKELRLIILSPLDTHRRNQSGTKAEEKAREILDNRGNSPRIYKNTLIFAAADERPIKDVKDETRHFLAWQKLVEDKVRRDLKPSQVSEADDAKSSSDTKLTRILLEAYAYALVPVQKEDSHQQVWDEHNVGGFKPIPEKVHKKLTRDEIIIPQMAPFILKKELDKYLWGDKNHIRAVDIWESFSKYLYFPRLDSGTVLRETIQDGVKSKELGFSTAFDDDKYNALRFGESGVTVYLDQNSVVVKPDIAQEYLESLRVDKEEESGETETTAGFDGFEVEGGAVERKIKAYFGSAKLTPMSVGRQVSSIQDEILDHLSKIEGVDLKITLEIEAKTDDEIKEEIRRIVEENAKTLKFKTSSFE